MKIDLTNNYPTGALAKQKHGNSLERTKYKSADLCGDNVKLNRGYYGGSFTGLMNVAAASAKAAGTATEKAVKDSLFDKLLLLCNTHTVIAQNLVAMILATTLRPIAIMSLPGKKNKEDKIYASGHSMASGIIGFGFSTIVMYPLGQAAKKAKAMAQNPELLLAKAKEGSGVIEKKLKSIYNVKTLKELESSKAFENITRMLNMAPDTFVFGVLKAILTIQLIKPILKYVFGLEKQPPQPPTKPEPIRTTMPKPEITKFAGGIK